MVDLIAKVVPDCASEATLVEMVEALRELHRCLEVNEPVPTHVGAIVAPGLGAALAAIDSGQQASLDQTLGLRRHGGVSANKAVANAEREALLRSLVWASPEWRNKPVASVSRELIAAFVRYETGRWKRERSARRAPHDEPFATFWKLKQSGLRLPGPEHLRKILSLVFQDPI